MKKFLIILGILCSFSLHAQDALIVDGNMSTRYVLTGFILEDGIGYECTTGTTWSLKYVYNYNTETGNAVVCLIDANGYIAVQRIYQNVVIAVTKCDDGSLRMVIADQYTIYLAALSTNNGRSWAVSLQHKIY